jgi:hypothetical protein
MKTNILLLTICVVTILILLPSISVAQFAYSLEYALAHMPTESVPFEATKTTPFLRNYNYSLVNPNNVIPDKLYDNVQLTEYTNASNEPELCGEAFRKFAIPNSNNKLLVVAFGGSTDWETYVICVVNPSGNVLSSLECEVRVMDVYVKQFRITADCEIIVTTIHPSSETSIPFATFTSFQGYRSDVTYSIDAQGQFIKTTAYISASKTQTYTRQYLQDKSKNLWESNESMEKAYPVMVIIPLPLKHKAEL